MRHEEDALQMAVAGYLDLLSAMHGFCWWHCPNGGSRRKHEGKRFKRMGVKAGQPDIEILHDGRIFFIELKTNEGKLHASQKSRIPMLEKCGAIVEICRSVDDVKRTMEGWKII